MDPPATNGQHVNTSSTAAGPLSTQAVHNRIARPETIALRLVPTAPWWRPAGRSDSPSTGPSLAMPSTLPGSPSR
jgi:hypothetical protein